MKGDLGRCALKGGEQMKLAEVESISKFGGSALLDELAKQPVQGVDSPCTHPPIAESNTNFLHIYWP